MKRTHLFGTVMACALATAVSVGAQDRPSTAASDQGKTVVVTGCLKSDPAVPSPTGTAGTAGTTSSPSTAARSSFIVTDAIVSSASGSTAGATATTSPTGTSPTGTSPTGTTPTGTTPTGTTPSATAGAAGTAGASPSADSKTFSLVGGTPSELQTYLNAKVEIRGTLDANAPRSGASGTPATGTAATGATPPSGTGAMSGMSHNQQLRVTSVKQLASSCSGQ